MKSLVRAAVLGMALLVIASPGLAQVSTHIPYNEYIKRNRQFAPLDESLFGDRVNLQDGGLAFVQRDVVLKTNSQLEVMLGRKTPSTKQGLDYAYAVFGEGWELDVPFMVQTSDDRDGWRSSGRCSNPDATAGTYMGPYPNWYTTPIHASSYWHGVSINIPGHGHEQMLAMTTAQQKPTDGKSYPAGTKSNWRVSCLAATADAGSEVFVVTLPDGTRYFFDWKADRDAIDLTDNGTEMLDASSDPTHLMAPLHDNFLYARRVEDRFGNWIAYTYDPVKRQRLTSIVSSDGVRLDVGYTGDRLTTVTAGGKVWTYSYDTSTTPTRLTSVTQPDGSSWTFSRQLPTTWTVTEANFYQNACAMNAKELKSTVAVVPSAATVYTMTHPSGASGIFKTRKLMQGTNNTPGDCFAVGDTSSMAFVTNGVPPAYGADSLYSKEITGPGIPRRSWTYMYYPSWSLKKNCTSGNCPTTSQTTVQAADGALRRYTFGNDWYTNAGRLLTETVENSGAVKQRKDYTFLSSAAGQPFPDNAGEIRKAGGFVELYGNPTLYRNRPLSTTATALDGVTLTIANTAFDAFQHPSQVVSSNSLGFSKTEGFEYLNSLPTWVLGLPTRRTINSVETERIEYAGATVVPYRIYSFGRLIKTLSFNPNGTLLSEIDALSRTTSYRNWSAGIPTAIDYPDGTQEGVTVDNIGLVRSYTDKLLAVTSYDYDSGDRLRTINHVLGDSVAWAPTGIASSFEPAAEFGVPGGHWKQVETTGAGRMTTIYNALLAPAVTIAEDSASAASKSYIVRRYDSNGRLAFESYPRAAVIDFASITEGTSFQYDALGRRTQAVATSELGPLTTKTDYLPQLKTRVTNPRGFQTTVSYQIFGTPSTDAPVLIEAPEGVTTTITRQPGLGKPTSVTRAGTWSGNPLSASRIYVYDSYERLCEKIEPESGATIVDYDGNDNIAWSADGQVSSGTTAASCAADRLAVTAANKISRTYDLMNRELNRTTTAGTSNVTTTYFADGQVQSVAATNPGGNVVTNTYTYNKRRFLTREVLQVNTLTPWTSDYAYNANGHLSSQTYPGNLLIGFAPDGLGRPTQAGTFATGVTYYPNGAMSGFTYGNGIVRTMSQNARQLPLRSLESYVSAGVTTKVMDDSYTYDANGNLLSLADASNAPAADNRSWGTSDPVANPGIATRYDGLERLLSVRGPSSWGSLTGNYNALYSYDPLDNLRSSRLGASALTFGYDSTNSLTQVANGLGSQWSVSSDTRGNVTANAMRNQAYEFDLSHRMNAVTGKESYAYDGHGRRARTLNLQTGSIEYFGYSKDGRLMQDWSNRRQVRNQYIYLGNTLVGLNEVSITTFAVAPRYKHTDTLGSPVVTTDAARNVLSRMSYTPYGAPMLPMDGVGYTGHFIDVGTQLTYMQQRYYDPQIGRFLSVDPVSTNANNGGNFNRYWYAADNPYRFKDPDGRYWCRASVDECRKIDKWVASVKVARDGLKPGSSEQKRLDAIVAKVGDPWKKNGVTFTSGALQPGTLAAAHQKSGLITIDFKQLAATVAVTQRLNPGVSHGEVANAEGANTVGHEVSHLVYNPSGNFTPRRDERRLGEIQAFGTGSTISGALGVDDGLHTAQDFLDAADASVKASCPGTGTYCQ